MAQSARRIHMTGIYKIENKLNGKIYIGQATDIELRFDQHKDALLHSNSSWYPEARLEVILLKILNFLFCRPVMKKNSMN